MFHLHIYLHKKLPFFQLTIASDDEASLYKENMIVHKGSKMYNFPNCKVCQHPDMYKIDWIRR